MVINFQDKNLIVSYIQVVLKETFGVTLRTSDTSIRNVSASDSYEITMGQSIKVTGVYDLTTYLSLALYMALNFPNEQFPSKWVRDGDWIKYPYEPVKLKDSANLIIEAFLKADPSDKGQFWNSLEEKYNELLKKIYDGLEKFLKDTVDPLKDWSEFCWNYIYKFYLTWKALVNNFNNEEDLVDVLSSCAFRENKVFTDEEVRSCLVKILSANIKISSEDTDVLQVPERVLSYIFDEVVTPLSSDDEVYRAQNLIYLNPQVSSRTNPPIGVYNDEMTRRVKEIQELFVKDNTLSTGDTTKVVMPGGFEDFKVTGYVDPWTELIVKRDPSILSEEIDNYGIPDLHNFLL